MSRTKGAKNQKGIKKIEPLKPVVEEIISIEEESDQYFDQQEIQTRKISDPFPDRPLLRVSEVSSHYGVTDRTVYLWLEHGHLRSEKTPGGQTRITKESVMDCKFGR